MAKEGNERMGLPNHNRCIIFNSSLKMVLKDWVQNSRRRNGKTSEEENNRKNRINIKKILNK